METKKRYSRTPASALATVLPQYSSDRSDRKQSSLTVELNRPTRVPAGLQNHQRHRNGGAGNTETNAGIQ